MIPGAGETRSGGESPAGPGAPRTPRVAPRPAGILKNLTWLGLGSAAVSPLWFFFISYLCIRHLTPEAYGLMNWALWLMVIAASVTDLGLNDFVTREVARQRDQAWRYFSNFLVFRGVFGVAIILIVIGVAVVLGAGDERVSAMSLAGFYALSVFLIGFCRVFFRAFQVLRYESISVILEKTLVMAFGTVALFATGTATGTLTGMVIGMVIALGITLWYVAWRIAPFEARVVKADFLKANLRIAAPLGVFAIAVIAFARMGPVILEFFEGAAEVGRFGAAFRIIEAMLLLPALATAALLPRMSSAWGSGDALDYGRLVGRATAGMAAVAGFLGLLLGVGGEALIDWMASDPAAYDGAGTTLRWLGLAYPAMCLNSVLSVSLIAADDQRFLARFMALTALAAALLFVAGIAEYGTAGLLVVFIGVLIASTTALWMRFRLLLGREVATA